MTPVWEIRERGLFGVEAEKPPHRRTPDFDYTWLDHYLTVLWPAPEKPLQLPPRIRGIGTAERLRIEQTLARTGSIAATMAECEVSYETVHKLIEWMAA